MALPESLRLFVSEPTVTNAAELRADIRSLPGFDPAASWVQVVEPLIEAGRHQEALDAITATLPASLMSPVMHLLASHCYRALGRDEEARFEATLTEAAIRLITAFGDGNEASPWPVLRVGDEYDALVALGLRSTRQSLYERGARMFDVHETADDREVWFELVG